MADGLDTTPVSQSVSVDELSKASLPSGYRLELARLASGVIRKAAGAAALAGAVLPSAPLMAAQGTTEGCQSVWNDWGITGTAVAAGAAAAAGWIAFFISQAAKSRRASEIDGLRDQLKRLQNTSDSVQATLGARQEIIKAFLDDLAAMPPEHSSRAAREVLSKVASKFAAKELAAILESLPPQFVIDLLSASNLPASEQRALFSAASAVSPQRQLRIFLGLLSCETADVLSKIWVPNSNVCIEAAKELGQGLLQKQPDLIVRAASSSFPALRMAAAAAAEKEPHRLVLLKLIGDDSPQVRDAALAKWLDETSGWDDLKRAIKTGGPASRQKALQLLTPEVIEKNRGEIVGEIASHSDSSLRLALFLRASAKLRGPDLGKIAQHRNDKEIHWGIFEHGEVDVETAAACLGRVVERITIVDQEEEGYTNYTDQYSSEWVVTTPAITHNEFAQRDTARVMKVLEHWPEQKVNGLWQALHDHELRSWLENEYVRTSRDRKISSVIERLVSTRNPAEAAEFFASLTPSDATSIIIARVEPALAAMVLRAMNDQNAVEITKTLPPAFILRTLQASNDPHSSLKT